MGKHENAVNEAAKTAELAKIATDILNLQAVSDEKERELELRSELLFSFEVEERRIAALLENADWSSKACVRKFRVARKHWWNKERFASYAMYPIEFPVLTLLYLLDLKIYLRSDGLLYFEYVQYEEDSWIIIEHQKICRPQNYQGSNKEMEGILSLLKSYPSPQTT